MTLIDKYNSEISNLCSQHKVRRLYAFGSVLTGGFGGDSDIDFFVDFQNVDLNHYADNYFSLKFSLEDMLNRPVDLLEEKTIKNPYFKNVVES